MAGNIALHDYQAMRTGQLVQIPHSEVHWDALQ